MNNQILDYQQDPELDLEKLNKIFNQVNSNRQYGDIIWNKYYYQNSSHEQKNLIDKIESKLIDNNEKYSRYPSDYLHCLMSLNSYLENFKGTTITFNNEKWKILEQFSEYGSNKTQEKLYSAYLYVNDENQQLVLSFSGTILNIQNVFKTNALLNNQIESTILNLIIPQLIKCYEMTLQANKIAKEKNYYLSFTGFSNGAWLAEYSYYFSIRYFDNFKTRAVLFDSPGIIQNTNDNFFNNQFDPKNFNIVNYLTTPHFANTLNKHSGTIYRIFLDERRTQDMKRSFLDSITKLTQAHDSLNMSRFFLEGLLSIIDYKRLELIRDLFDPTTGMPNYHEKMSKWPMVRIKLSQNFQDHFRKMSKQQIKTLVELIPLSNLIKSPACYILEQIFINISEGLNKNMSPGIHVLPSIFMQLATQNIEINRLDVPLFEKKISTQVDNYKDNNLDLFDINNKNDVYLDIRDQFSLLLSSNYETDQYSDKNRSLLEIKNETKNIDWCLYQLKQTNLEREVPSKLVNYQLNKLKSYYTIKSNNNKDNGDTKILYSNTITIDMLKERMIRLLNLYPNIKDLLSNVYGETYHIQLGHKLNQKLDPFIGRQKILEQINEILSMKEHNAVILSGQSGNGKSCVANEYAHRVKNDVSNIKVRWFNCETRDKINCEYLELAKLYKINMIENLKTNDLIQHVNRKLQESSKTNYLFILDNVNDFQMINDIFLKNLTQRKFKFIIITEKQSFEFSNNYKIINLGPFNVDEAQEYIEKYSKMNLNETQINNLIKVLMIENNKFLQPFNLNLIVKYINSNSSISFDSILTKLQHDKSNLSNQKIFQSLNPQCLNYLSHLGYLDGDSISFELLKKIYLKNNYSLSFEQILDNLARKGLIEMNLEQQSIKIHKLVQKDIAKFLHPNKNIFKNLLIILNDHFERSSRSIKNYDYIHLIKIQQTKDSDFDLLKLKYKLANYHLNSMNEYEKSLRLNLEVNEWFQNYSQHYAKELSTSYSSISQIYTRLEDYRKALDYSLKSQKLKINLYDQIDLHPDLAQSFSNSGCIYSKLNMDQEAIDCDLKAYKIRSELYENMDHRDLASSLNNLGVSYSKIDEVKSFEYKLKAFEMQSRIFKQQSDHLHQNDYRSLAVELKNVGLYYLKKEHYNQAIKSLKEAYDINYRIYEGRDHSELANLMINLGNCYEKLNNLDEAYKLYMKSFDMRSRLFENNINHPDLIEAKYLIDKINEKRRLLEQTNSQNRMNIILQCDKCFRLIQDKEILFTCTICDDYHMCLDCYNKLSKRSDSELNHQMYHPLIKFNQKDFIRQNWLEIWSQNFKFENLIKKSKNDAVSSRINRICSYCRENLNGDLFLKYDQSTYSCLECWVKKNRNNIFYRPVEVVSRFENNKNQPAPSSISSAYLKLYCDKCDKEVLNNTLYSCTICNNYHMCLECFETVRLSSDGHEKFHPLIQFQHNQSMLQSRLWKHIWFSNYKLEKLMQKYHNSNQKTEYCSFCNDLIDGLSLKFCFGLKNSCMNCWIKYRNSSRMIEPVEINNEPTSSNHKIINVYPKSGTFLDQSNLKNESSKIIYTNFQSF